MSGKFVGYKKAYNLLEDNKIVAQQGGNVAKVALKELEAKTGKKIVSALNAKSILSLNGGNYKDEKTN